MAINQISEILKKKGFTDLKPSDEVLQSLGTPDIKKWNKWVNKKSDPELWQIPIIAEFLNCSIDQIIPTKQEQ